MKLNSLLRNTLNRVFPIIHQIEENPLLTIKQEITPAGDFSTFAEQPYGGKTYNEYKVKCIFVEEPIIISTNNQVFTKKQMVFYVKKEDLEINLTLNDILVFKGVEYKIQRIQEIFPLVKIEVEKISI